MIKIEYTVHPLAAVPGTSPSDRSSEEPSVSHDGSGSRPVVSIIMGAYNCARTLPDAIDSILAQTYDCWELIICDDGSRDATYEVALTYARNHARIRVLRNDVNAGLAPTLNKCFASSTGSLIARMDGDDTCAPTRLEKQVRALAADPTIAFLGTGMRLFDDDGVWGTPRPIPSPMAEHLLHGNPMCHGSVIMRREALTAVGGYSELQRHWRVEDMNLWLRFLARGYRAANLIEPLYSLRSDRTAAARRSLPARVNESLLACQIVRTFGLDRWNYVRALRPIILGVLPLRLYHGLHRRRQISLSRAAYAPRAERPLQ